ncbi:MAG: hypothetical protein SGI74_03510 [Oligoflexia bacterium]|nr:hypothetical protein [Oligoflexia bacterium]
MKNRWLDKTLHRFALIFLSSFIVAGCLNSKDKAESVSITPTTITINTNTQQVFTALGGASPYKYSILTGGGTIDGTSGIYKSAASPATVIVQVTDSAGSSALSTVTVIPGLTVTPSAPTVNIGAGQSFSVSGGTPPYLYLMISGGGSITTGGVYTAPSTSGSASIRVLDSVGVYLTVPINIINGPAISPASQNIAVNRLFTFTNQTGAGVGPFSFSIISGSGSITSVNAVTGTFTYLAPASIGSASVRITDSNGYNSDAAITIFTPVKIKPALGFNCVLKNDGTVKCWGSRNYGALGDGSLFVGESPSQMGDNLPTVRLGTGRTATAITTGSSAGHNCVVLDNNTMKCWGNGGSGQLGYGDGAHRGGYYNQLQDNFPIINLGSSSPIVQIGAASSSSCALINIGPGAINELRCWGYNLYGQLGLGDVAARYAPTTPINFGGDYVTKFAMGYTHICAILNTGAVKCWGYNGYGELGQDNTTQLTTPSAALNLGTTAIDIGAGSYFTCALLTGGNVKCWGYNNGNGQLGIGNNNSMGDGAGEMAALPTVNLGTGRTATSIVVNGYNVCAKLDDNTFLQLQALILHAPS